MFSIFNTARGVQFRENIIIMHFIRGLVTRRIPSFDCKCKCLQVAVIIPHFFIYYSHHTTLLTTKTTVVCSSNFKLCHLTFTCCKGYDGAPIRLLDAWMLFCLICICSVASCSKSTISSWPLSLASLIGSRIS